jgi:hypothetical protein
MRLLLSREPRSQLSRRTRTKATPAVAATPEMLDKVFGGKSLSAKGALLICVECNEPRSGYSLRSCEATMR